MIRIEFIGASGVGKSTLIKLILKNRSSNENWLTPAEAREKIARQIQPDSISSIKLKIIRTLLLRGLYTKSFKTYLVDSLLDQYEDVLINTSLAGYNVLLDLMIYKLAQNHQIEARKKAQVIKTAFNSLLRNYAIFDYFKLEDCILYDESIIKNNMWSFDDQEFNQSFNSHPQEMRREKPDGVIYCQLDFDETYNRRLNRIQKRKANDPERRLSPEELRLSCQLMLENSEKKVAALQTLGISVLVLNMNEPLETNLNIAQNYIRNVIDSIVKS
jgi:adenylate kinase family enzyme